ncbi:helix-turn-helix domain-containing protein [Neptunicella sp. SCSIO 80796]|uniref:helix-turn-helix domain-containing protein n=1 Tax=Neptunicella plasticusilytica TaxID=3117012 RepID=UPI003A4D9F1A
MTFQDVLNAVTAELSDYAAAKKLGISRHSFSQYRNGKNIPREEILDKMAEMSGLDPTHVYLAAYAEKLHNPMVAERFRTLAA